jgi:hypothetical protein
LTFTLSKFEKDDGFALGLGMGGLAFGLHGFELGCVLFDGAVDATFIEGEELKLARPLDPGNAFGKGGIDFAMAGVLVVRVLMALGKDGVFERAGTLKAPAVFGDLVGW